MKILLVWPKFPETFWGFKYALKFIGKKAAFPPLGLMTVAAMMPQEWEKKLIDLNVEKLKDEDLSWADYLFISAMIIQKKSVRKIIARAKKFDLKIVAGGPVFITGYQEFAKEIDHFILGEAENILPLFLKDLEKNSTQQIYLSQESPDITQSPVPCWELIDFKKYSSMNIQYSRGCPFNCEFCDVIVMNGRVPRTKKKEQILAELEKLYQMNWRGPVFIVDDNFIGNKVKLKQEILPALINWSKERKYPFSFTTEASINLSDDEELMKLMTEAGFTTVFIGIETPDEKSLKECGKFHNLNRDLVACVKKIQNHGLQVQGGFIVGFDSDTPSIFKRQIEFIQKSGIVTAMVGLLNAFPKTRLYQRLKAAGRLLRNTSGSNTSLNFIPKMNKQTLLDGYQKVIKTIYSPKHYYQRIITFLKEYKPKRLKKNYLPFSYLKAFVRSIFILGLKEKERFYFWKLFFWSLFKRPQLFSLAITLAIYGFHFRKISEKAG